MPEDLPRVTVYTDGACNPNPGPGGWAAVLLFPDQEPQELSGSASDTTSNRMELQAASEALLTLPGPHRVHLHTDSEYLRQGVTEWLPLWEKRNWQTAEKNDVKNQDLWQLLAAQLERHYITWHWVKGHASDKWNEYANNLAQSAIPNRPLPLNDDQAIHIFTAASFLGKQESGGWGVVLRYRDTLKTLSGGVLNTSSNRMHLQAAIEGLKALKKPMPVHLYTTSDYLRDGATIWVKKWSTREWQTKEGKPVSHRDLWEMLVSLMQTYQIHWHVVSKTDLPVEMLQAKRLSSEAARSSQSPPRTLVV